MQSVRAEIDYTIGEIEKEIPHIRQADPKDLHTWDWQTRILSTRDNPDVVLQDLLRLVERKMHKVYENCRQTLERPDRLGTGLTFEVALLDNLITLHDLVCQMRYEAHPLTWERTTRIIVALIWPLNAAILHPSVGSPSKAQLLRGIPDQLQAFFNSNLEIVLTQKVFLDMLCNQLQAQQEQIVRSDFKTSAQELLHVLDQDLHLNSQDLLKGTHETATHVWRLDIAIQNGERARWEEERRNLQLLKSDFPLTTYAQLLVEFLKNVNAVIWEEEPTARWSHNSPPRKRDSSSAVKEACRACIVVIQCGLAAWERSQKRPTRGSIPSLAHPSWSRKSALYARRQW